MKGFAQMIYMAFLKAVSPIPRVIILVLGQDNRMYDSV